MKRFNNIIKLKGEKGAVSSLVLFTVLMFIVILMGVYLTITAKQKAQIKSDMRIEQVYGQDIENVDYIYNKLVTNKI